MDDASIRGVLEATSRLTDQSTGIGDRQRPERRNQPRQIHSLDQLHGEVHDPVRFARVYGPDDVRMIEPADGFHLSVKSRQSDRNPDPAGGQDFQGHRPFQARVDRFVNGPHRPLAQFPDKPVGAHPFRKRAIVAALGRSFLSWAQPLQALERFQTCLFIDKGFLVPAHPQLGEELIDLIFLYLQSCLTGGTRVNVPGDVLQRFGRQLSQVEGG
jgi:hypothetical protein